MPGAKPVIFISHITEEGELGALLKDRLEKDFLSLIDVFVSSDPRSIAPGDPWLKRVDEKLDSAAALVVLASPASIKRPWITFEAGAGWAKNVPVMILCHSGMEPGQLPLPLSQLQAFGATDKKRLQAMYGVIAAKLGGASPDPDLSEFLARVAEIEARYSEERDVLSALREIKKIEPQVIDIIAKQIQPGTSAAIESFPESIYRKIEPALDTLASRGYAKHTLDINAMMFGGAHGGNQGTLHLIVTQPVVEGARRKDL